MRPRKIVLGINLSVAIAVLLLTCFIPGKSTAQFLNLNGIIDLDYNSTINTTSTSGEERKSSTSDFLQRYTVSGSGIIVDPRLASYSASIGLSDSVFSNKSVTGDSTKITRGTLTYSLQMGLLPTRFPVNFYAQRNLISVENSPDLISDIYSIGWFSTLQTQTMLRLTMLQIGTEFNDPTNPKDTRIRIANLSVDQRFRAGSLGGNIQHTEYLISDKNQETESKVDNYSIRGDSRLTPNLFLDGNITYFPKGGFNAPGLATTPETTGDIGLIHQVERFSQGSHYTFRKTPGGEIERDSISYNINYRPLGKTDYRGDAIYSSTTSLQTDAKEYRLSGGLNHRPFYGLSIMANMILNRFEVSGLSTNNSTDRIGTMAGINYYKLLEVFNFNSNYMADFSRVFSGQDGAGGGILTQTASVGIQSRTLEKVQVMGSYTFLLRNNSIVPTDDRQEQALRIETLSNYFRRSILRASTSFSNVLNYGDTFVFDSRVEYFPIAGTNLIGGYKFSNFPSSTSTQDSHTAFIEGTHLRYLTRRLNLNIMVHGERESYIQTDIERSRLTLTSILNYQLGKITLNLEFREDYTKYPESVYNVQSYFVRASRPF